jgi:hypothetical protein
MCQQDGKRQKMEAFERFRQTLIILRPPPAMPSSVLGFLRMPFYPRYP